MDTEAAFASFDPVLATRPDYGPARLGNGIAQLYKQNVPDGVQDAAAVMPDYALAGQMVSGDLPATREHLRKWGQQPLFA